MIHSLDSTNDDEDLRFLHYVFEYVLNRKMYYIKNKRKKKLRGK